MADFPHLDPDARSAVFAAPAERKRIIAQRTYVSFPAGELALQHIVRLGEALPGRETSFVQLRGRPFSGKRAVLEEAHRLLRSSYPLERRSVSILTDNSPSPGMFLNRLLVAAEAPFIWSGRAESQQRPRALSHFARENVRIVLARKLHNAAPTPRAALPYLTMFRSFCEEAGIHAAFTTNRLPKEFINRDVEFAARTTEFVFDKWPIEQWALKAVAFEIRRYPLRRETVLDWRFMELLYGRSGGLPGQIFPLLKEAGQFAIDSGEERLSRELLETVSPPRRAT